jgi:Flp pilus assembly pilin Flp
MANARETERGSASVEQAGLVALIALLLLAGIAAIAAGGKVDASRGLAAAIAKRIACAPHLPEPCRHHPLAPAYGWPLARLTRALAPFPLAKSGPSGMPLVPVDFRRCRRESCAIAAGPHLSASGRRTTAFTQLFDRRRTDGWVDLTYWLYRPGLGWEGIARRADQAQIDAASNTPVLLKDDPALVPLETLPGHNHYDFPRGERPPWQWQIHATYPGWRTKHAP